MSANLLLRANKLLFLILMGLAFLAPLFFLPTTQDFFEYNKRVLLISATIFTLFLWALKMVLTHQVRIIRTRLELPLLLFWGSLLISTFVSPNRLVSLVSSQTWLLFCLPLLYFIYLNNLRAKKHIQQTIFVLILSGTLVSLWSISYYFWPSLTKILTPAGSITNANALALMTLVLSFSFTFSKNISTLAKTLLNIVTGASLFSLLLTSPVTSGFFNTTLSRDYPKPLLLDFSTSWQIAFDSIKNNPLWGSGPGTYVEDFIRFKPLSFNLSPYWNINFGSASNTPLQLLSENGLFGFFAFLGILAACLLTLSAVVGNAPLRSLRPAERETPEDHPKNEDDFSRVLVSGLVVSLLNLFIFPLTAVILFLFLLMAALFEGYHFLLQGRPEQEVQISLLALPTFLINRLGLGGVSTAYKPNDTLLPRFIFTLTLLLATFSFYALGRLYMAEATFKQSLDALAAQKGTETYDLQREALRLNPYEARYHLAYADTNFALANAIAEQNKDNLTDTHRQQIVQLIQQAVREAQLATAIAPNNPVYWESLALVYKNIMGVADGADQWSITAYSRAINLNPLNPRLRIDLGGVYYRLEDYERAAVAFQTAINLKNDYANAYYNLAWAWRQSEKYRDAVAAMELVLNLVMAETEDSAKVQKELEELRSLAAQQEGEAVPQAQIESAPQNQVLGQEESLEIKVEPEEATRTALPEEPLGEPQEQPETTPSSQVE